MGRARDCSIPHGEGVAGGAGGGAGVAPQRPPGGLDHAAQNFKLFVGQVPMEVRPPQHTPSPPPPLLLTAAALSPELPGNGGIPVPGWQFRRIGPASSLRDLGSVECPSTARL